MAPSFSVVFAAALLCALSPQGLALELSAQREPLAPRFGAKPHARSHPARRPSRALRRSATASRVRPTQAPVVPAVPVNPVFAGTQGGMDQLLVNNLGGLGPDLKSPPVIVIGGVFSTFAGTLVDLVIRNTTRYDAKDIGQTGVSQGFGAVNIRAPSAVTLNCTLVDRLSGLPVTVDRFSFTVVDLNTMRHVQKMVIAEPSSYTVSPDTTLTIASSAIGNSVIASTSEETTDKKPKTPLEMQGVYLQNSVELVYEAVSSFVVTFQVDIPEDPAKVMGHRLNGNQGRVFLFGGRSILETVGASINATATNQSEMIAAGQGLGMPPVPALPITKLPNASELANMTATGMAPTGQPLPAPTALPVQYASPTGLPVVPASGVAAPVATQPCAQSSGAAPSPMLAPIPEGTPRPGGDVVMCATEWSSQQAGCKECTMSNECLCNGHVTFGYDNYWTPWQPVRGVIECSVDTFGDPYFGQGKICLCSGAPISSADGYWSGPTFAGTWWPIVAVIVPAAALAIVLGLAHMLSPEAKGFTETALHAAAPAALIAPMIAAIFVAVAKRGEYLVSDPVLLQVVREAQGAAGSPDLADYHILVVAIRVCSVAFIFQLAFRVIYELVTLNEHQHHHDRIRRQRGWSFLHQVSVTIMYAALTVIVVRLCMMGNVAFTLATQCTILLASVLFACHLVLHVLTFLPFDLFFRAIMKLACLNMNFAPMLCILFFGVQVAADKIVGNMVPGYAVLWMKICTAAVLVQTGLSMLTPAIAGAMLKQDNRGREDLAVRRGPCLLFVSFCRWVVMAAQYVGVGVLCFALWQLDAGGHLARVLSGLAIAYFLIYAMVWITMTAQHLAGSNFEGAIKLMLTFTHLANLCPMVAALVLGVWMVKA